jgi:hypothetical protein
MEIAKNAGSPPPWGFIILWRPFLDISKFNFIEKREFLLTIK